MGKFTKLGFLIVTVLLVVGAFFLLSSDKKNSSNNVLSQTIQPVSPIDVSDHVKGNIESKVVLIEYSDLQCPACKVYHPVLKKLNEDFKGKIAFAYRHFPLRGIHKYSDISAQAAEAASYQNKFWEMADKLFDEQDKWSAENYPKDLFIEYASSLGLDVEKFKKDLDSNQLKDKIEKDYQSGIKAGVNATPTFFLNGIKLDNPRTYEEFKGILENALN